MSDVDWTGFVLDFASEGQWTDVALQAFGKRRGLRRETLRSAWPRGIRSVARALNDAADKRMVDGFLGRAAPSLEALIMWRFAENARLKHSVARLAISDALHPFDTLLRTAGTARAMLRICVRRDAWHQRWRLVFVYSAAVLV